MAFSHSIIVLKYSVSFIFCWFYICLYSEDKIRYNFRLIFNYKIQSDLTKIYFIFFSNWTFVLHHIYRYTCDCKNNRDPMYALHSFHLPQKSILQNYSTLSQPGYCRWQSEDTEHGHHHNDPSFYLYSHPHLPPTPTSSCGKRDVYSIGIIFF